MRRSVPLLLLATLPLFAQRADKIDVRVINVDVHVTGADGNPFLGLGPADFEVLEDGKPQPITNFHIVEKTIVRNAPGGAAQPADTRFRRRVAVVVDNNNLEKRERDQALLTFNEFIDQNAGPDAEWSVGIIGERFELLQPFTSDRAALKTAMTKVRNTPVTSSVSEQRRELLSDQARRNSTKVGHDYAGSVAFASREQTYRAARNSLNTAKGIVEATRLYGDGSGKKVMFLISGGMQLNTTFTAYENGSADREVNDARREVQKLLEEVVREANAGNVMVDVIAARTRGSMAQQFDVQNASSGLKVGALKTNIVPDTAEGAANQKDDPRSSKGSSSFRQMTMNDPTDVSDLDSSGFKIAVATGGQYLTSNRVRDSFDLAEKSSSHYYSLGYRPPHDEDGRYHQISVRLKKPGYRLSHRQGYSDTAPEMQLEEMLRLPVSAAQPMAALPVTLEAAPTAGTVAVTAALPMKHVSLVSSGDGAQLTGRVHVYISIFDSGGKNIAFHHKTQEINVPAELREDALAETFRFKTALKLEPGEYTLAVTMRDDLARDAGTAVQKIKL
jgi:VWFA-related protein